VLWVLNLIQVSQWILVQNTFLFWSIDHTFYTFLSTKKNNIFYENKYISNIYKNIFIDLNYKNISISEKNVFFLKFYFLWTKNYNYNFKKVETNNPTIKIGKNLGNIFSSAWNRVFEFCNNFLFNFFLNDMKLLVLDADYKNFFFFLSNNFNKVDMANNIDFFFPKSKNFSKRSWVYFFSQFCDKQNISALFISDTVLINRNVSMLSELGLPIIAFMIHKNDTLIDYSFFLMLEVIIIIICYLVFL
jgi:hypothetical protein